MPDGLFLWHLESIRGWIQKKNTGGLTEGCCRCVCGTLFSLFYACSNMALRTKTPARCVHTDSQSVSAESWTAPLATAPRQSRGFNFGKKNEREGEKSERDSEGREADNHRKSSSSYPHAVQSKTPRQARQKVRSAELHSWAQSVSVPVNKLFQLQTTGFLK